MKSKSLLLKVIVASALILGVSLSFAKSESRGAEMSETMIKEESVLRHAVYFKFKDGVAAERITGVEKAFAALPDKISVIQDFEWGINNSPEGLDKGITHCFLVTFKSEADRDAYLPNPDHQAFVKLLDGIVDDVVVVDYWTK